jgi:hypothetical protein
MKILLSAAFAAALLVGNIAQADGPFDSFQSAEMIDFATGTPVVGGGVLYRSANAVKARFSTTGLDKKASYTVWWIVFNNPVDCSPPGCGEDDIFSGPGMLNTQGIALAKISVLYADGFVTGTDGVGNVTANLNAGIPPDGMGVNFGWDVPADPADPAKRGLRANNGNRAEIHMVVRSHSKSIAGQVGFQTSNFDGGCGVCEDQQAIVFNPL